MTDETKDTSGFSSMPPISAMLQNQGAMSAGNKFTNVFMPNQQQAVMEYVSEPFISEAMQGRHPLAAMLLKKRSLGIENEVDRWINDNEYNYISLLERMGYYDLAETEALSHVYHREGLRTDKGFERDHQVMQKTLSEEKLTTVSNPNKQSFWSKIGRFGKGNNQQVVQQ